MRGETGDCVAVLRINDVSQLWYSNKAAIISIGIIAHISPPDQINWHIVQKALALSNINSPVAASPVFGHLFCCFQKPTEVVSLKVAGAIRPVHQFTVGSRQSICKPPLPIHILIKEITVAFLLADNIVEVRKCPLRRITNVPAVRETGDQLKFRRQLIQPAADLHRLEKASEEIFTLQFRVCVQIGV